MVSQLGVWSELLRSGGGGGGGGGGGVQSLHFSFEYTTNSQKK